VSSRTRALDPIIRGLNEMLEAERDRKEKLRIYDRILKAQAIRYRVDKAGRRGKKFRMTGLNQSSNAHADSGDEHGREH
jgi:hypothetical protein